jgi:hypothetical protein
MVVVASRDEWRDALLRGLPRLEVRLLNEVERLLFVAKQAVQVRVELSLVAIHQPREVLMRQARRPALAPGRVRLRVWVHGVVLALSGEPSG